MTSYKSHFTRVLAADSARLHFAAHSHHLWPDVSFDAQVRCWEDSAHFADTKWDHVFGELLPRVRARVARVLGVPDPASIVFAASTHELVMRVVSCLPLDRPVEILTTDGEFHSFRRQWMRLAEVDRARVTVVPVEPFETFPARMQREVVGGEWDLVYVSHVMYDSGYVVPNLSELVASAPERAEIIVDGYHGFMALPAILEPIAARAFYVGGGYKYAMSGEGACFMHCPPGRCARPVDTGWFAGFGHLTEGKATEVHYGDDASRFAGATFDPTGVYRMDAVLGLWEELGVQVRDIHAHVVALQSRFLELLRARPRPEVCLSRLIPDSSVTERGHFLTFRTPLAGEIHARLAEARVVTDFRGDRLRFGFGIYQDAEDVDELAARL